MSHLQASAFTQVHTTYKLRSLPEPDPKLDAILAKRLERALHKYNLLLVEGFTKGAVR